MSKYIVCKVVIIFSIMLHSLVALAETGSNDESYVLSNDVGAAEDDIFNFEVLDSTSQPKINFPMCNESPPDLGACTAYVCKVKAAFGDVFVKVKGMQNGKCQYLERTFGIDGINCQFKKDRLSILAPLFSKRFRKLSGTRVALTGKEYEDLAQIFKKECIIMPDYNTSKLIPLNKINASEPDPEFNIKDIAKYSVIAKPKAAALKPNEAAALEYKASLSNYRSIMLIREPGKQ